MTEMYGSYSDEDLNEWERMPQNIRVLTSSAFGAWLLRRDKRIKEQEPKTGHWTRELIRNEYGGCIGAKMICSECGQDNGYDRRMKFCPNCGAKMEVEHETD